MKAAAKPKQQKAPVPVKKAAHVAQPPVHFDAFAADVTRIFDVEKDLFEGLKLIISKSAYKGSSVVLESNLGDRIVAPDVSVGVAYDTKNINMKALVSPSGVYKAELHAKALNDLVRLDAVNKTLDPRDQGKGVLSPVYGTLNIQTTLATISAKIKQDGMKAIDYSQQLTPNLVAGVEAGSYDLKKGLLMKFAARYTMGKDIAFGSIDSADTVSLAYGKQVTKEAFLATQMHINTRLRDSYFSFGYRFELPQCIARGMIDSHGRVCAVMTTPVTPFVSLTFSGLLDHAASASRFGVGISIAK